MPPEAALGEPVFFVDRSLGGKWVVEALRGVGAQVVVHDDVFDQNAPDVEWLEETARRGWLVLTKDGAMRRNPHELAMIRLVQARVFTLSRQDLTGQEMAALLVRALAGMRKRATATEPPFVYSITRGGDFKRLD